MTYSHRYKLYLIILLVITIFLRLSGLGLSHFYGDETKTFYMDKTVSAPQFFLQQRKGPVQFMVVWVVEKLTNSYNELNIRLPFAVAGIFSVIVFYLYVIKKYSKSDKNIALIATYIFSLSGFFIAFSRTAQYQSFLIFFGLMSLLAWEYKRPIISGVFMGLAFLCHYDAVFFILPLIPSLIQNSHSNKKNVLKYVIPMIFITNLFYLPYIVQGAFLKNTMPYIQSRITGEGYLPNNSLFTYTIYNPNPISVGIFVFAVIPLVNMFKKHKEKRENWNINLLSLILWFLVPFILFEFAFSNPGTHIYNYLIPLIILTALGISTIMKHFKSLYVKNGIFIILNIVALTLVFTNLKTYVPLFNTGYPWNNDLKKRTHQIFLYGFPYNRGWDQVTQYFKQTKNIENFYTNDNITVGQFYSYPTPSYEKHPKYYVYVNNNQVNGPFDNWILKEFEYTPVKDIYVSGIKTITIYQRAEKKRYQSPNIIVEYPQPNDIVKSPLVIKGKARGTWYFEGDFPVTFYYNYIDKDAKITTYAKAIGEWMTEDYVPFEAKIEFPVTSANGGILILSKDNPSDLRELDEEISIVVKFR